MPNKNSKLEIERSDLIYIKNAIEGAYAELEAAVKDGLVKDDVLIELEEALDSVKELLS